MGYKEDTKKILIMLKDQKITAIQAELLLKSIENNNEVIAPEKKNKKENKFIYDIVEDTIIDVTGNGKINISSTTGDKAIIKLLYDENKVDELSEILQVDSNINILKIFLNKNNNIASNLNVFLPKIQYEKILVNGENTKVIFNDIKCEHSLIKIKKGKVRIENCFVEEQLKVVIEEGKLEINNLNTNILRSNQITGDLKVYNSKVNNSDCVLEEGKVKFYDVGVFDEKVAKIKLNTQKGDIIVFTPHRQGSVFNCNIEKEGSIVVGSKYFYVKDKKLNKEKLVYAKGQSKYGNRASRYVDVDLQTNEGNISLDWT